MNILAQAVESAAEALAGVRGDHGNWRHYEVEARLALEAAAPHMLASAWEEGMQAMYDTTSSEWPPIPDQNPYRPTA